jgi:hypothetical protein
MGEEKEAPGMADKGDELVKYITERVVAYMKLPRDVRRRSKASVNGRWDVRWFGMVPLAVAMWARGLRRLWRSRRRSGG